MLNNRQKFECAILSKLCHFSKKIVYLKQRVISVERKVIELVVKTVNLFSEINVIIELYLTIKVYRFIWVSGKIQ